MTEVMPDSAFPSSRENIDSAKWRRYTIVINGTEVKQWASNYFTLVYSNSQARNFSHKFAIKRRASTKWRKRRGSYPSVGSYAK